MNDIHLDPARQEQAIQYARIRRRLLLVELTFGGLYLFAWVYFAWGSSVREAIQGQLSFPLLGDPIPWWIELALIAIGIGLPWLIVTSPLAVYQGYVLPHRFGLSTQTLKSWLLDQLKGFLVGGVLGGGMLLGLYALVRLFPTTWWLPSGIAYSLFTVVLTILAPVILMPIFLKSTPLSEEYATLIQRLLQLAERTGTQVDGVFSIDLSRRTRAANAALAGLGKTRRILLGDTLLENFSEGEIAQLI